MSTRLHAALVLLLLPLASCADEERQTLQVLAAASLTDVFTDLAATFEDDHPGVDVQLSLGSSTDLAGQAADGAPGDVLATADEESMRIAEEAGAAARPLDFATNHLVIVTPRGNPAAVASVRDLAGTTWVRCADDVPCGRTAVAVLEQGGAEDEPVSLEEDVRGSLDKVVSGEADAALVYASDAVSAGDEVVTVPIDGAEDLSVSYWIALLEQSADADLAGDFVDLVRGDQGLAALQEAGFGPR